MVKSGLSERKIRGKCRIKDQSGSTLVTVLVGVSFLVILASMILTISFANLRMKQLEYRMKQNFYEDEQALDDVYNGLGRDISQCLSKAYNDTLVKATDGTTEYNSQSKAYEKFVTLFEIRMEAMFGGDGEHKEETKEKLKGYITNETDGAGNVITEAEIVDYGSTVLQRTDAGYLSRYLFQDVQVRFVEKNGTEPTGYESTITTDIVVEVPYVNFFQDFSRVLDYSLIGNKGVYFENAGCTVEGNVYAGTSEKTDNASYQGYRYSEGNVYDGMNFYNSNVTFENNNYIVSKGDMNICQSQVTVTAPSGKKAMANIWAENIRTVENKRAGAPVSVNEKPDRDSILTANANFYVADDLELSARNSRVSLSGNYYGYNNNTSVSGSAYATEEKENLKGLYDEAEEKAASHASSSAVLVNANDSVLDLTGLDSLVITGLAYVDVKNPLSSYGKVEADGEKVSEYQTGESLALRYNQILYLAPMDILYETNPARDGSLEAAVVCPPVGAEKSKLADWFGSGYLNAAEPVTPVVYQYNGIKYTYYYLNFKSEPDKSAYVQEIMEATEPSETATAFEKQKWQLKQEVLAKAQKAGIESNIQIDGSGCKIYAKGIITNTADGSMLDNTVSKPAVYKDSLKMADHFVHLHKKLDPAEQYGLVSDLPDWKDDDKIIESILAEGKEEQLPAAYFVEFDNIVTDAGKGVKGYQVIIKTDASVSEISGDVKGIIISKGDIIISGNVEGLVISGGKIKVTSTGSVRANRGIVQNILETEQRELSGIKEDKVDRDFLSDYASYYFKQPLIDDTLVNEGNHKYIDNSQRVTSMEYTDYMYYENWRKGAPAP